MKLFKELLAVDCFKKLQFKCTELEPCFALLDYGIQWAKIRSEYHDVTVKMTFNLLMDFIY